MGLKHAKLRSRPINASKQAKYNVFVCVFVFVPRKFLISCSAKQCKANVGILEPDFSSLVSSCYLAASLVPVKLACLQCVPDVVVGHDFELLMLRNLLEKQADSYLTAASNEPFKTSCKFVCLCLCATCTFVCNSSSHASDLKRRPKQAPCLFNL